MRGNGGRALDALIAAIDELQQVDLSALSEPLLLERLEVLRRQTDRLESVWSAHIAAVHGRGAASADGYVSTSAYLRHRCKLNPGAARTRIDVSAQLAELPAVAQAFAAGDIGFQQTAQVVKALDELPPELARKAEPSLLTAARHNDPAALAQIIRRLRYIVDPDGQADLDAKHHERRWLEVATTFRGTVTLNGLLDPEAGAALRAALDALDLPLPADVRTAAQRRADALCEMTRRLLDAAELPENGGERPHLSVVVDLATLMAARDEVASGERDDGIALHPPGELAWVGPIGQETARRLACDCLVSPVVVTGSSPGADPPPDAAGAGDSPEPGEAGSAEVAPGEWVAAAGAQIDFGTLDLVSRTLLRAVLPPPLRGGSLPLDVGRTSRTVTAAIRRALVIRDGGCAFPGCHRPPSWTDAHHMLHWLDGGSTAVGNLVLLCRHHHRFVHEGDWKARMGPQGRPIFIPPERWSRSRARTA